jgi:hypothetical protein
MLFTGKTATNYKRNLYIKQLEIEIKKKKKVYSLNEITLNKILSIFLCE